MHKCISDHRTCIGSGAAQEALCTVCQRSPGDLKRHKGLLEREKPVLLQCSVNGVSVGLGVLEALLSTGDHAIHIRLFYSPFMGNT